MKKRGALFPGNPCVQHLWQQLLHSFLFVPECPIPLIGRDLLIKLGATLFSRDKENLFIIK